ncbi:MAG TPA: pyruvate dehydrogenase complex dihydrolipoamide acetyltransferase [Caulobacteraceae bacterium]|jgi:pyruvate dehydrogenase E2 component (dihydrolipoamide acetyltransferase)
MTDILMPALSPTMEEGTLAKWLVKEGDTISAGQVIAEIETDKATMEVEAVDEGVVEAILVQAGSEGVKVNAPIARLKGEGGGASPAPPTSTAAKRPQGEHETGSATITDQGVQPPPPGNAVAPSPAAPSQQAGETGATTQAPRPQTGNGASRVFASPLAKRLAQAAGIDLGSVKGSGPHGRILKADIESARGGAPAQQTKVPGAPQPAAPAPALVQAPAQHKTLEQMGVQPGSYELVPLDNIMKVSARRLTEAFRDIPHFPLTIDLEIDKLLEARKRLNAAQSVKISVNDIIIKAVAMALQKVPEANAAFTPEGIARFKHADIAIAVAIPGGLITPIIRKAEQKGLAQIATEAKDLAARARDKKLKPDEFMGGTFTVSNLGMFGIKSFASIINEPGACIMSVGAGEQRPVVKNGALAIANVMTVTVTCDHRAVDGATGARFLQAFRPMIEDPIAMLA